MLSGIGESGLTCSSWCVSGWWVSGGRGDLYDFAVTKGQLCSHIPADAYLFCSLVAQQLVCRIVAIFGNCSQCEFEPQLCHFIYELSLLT